MERVSRDQSELLERSVLHRGMLKHIIKGDDRLYDLEEVNRWAQRLIDLLASHTAMVPHGNRVLLVNMNFGTGEPVMVATADGIHDDAFVVAEPVPEAG